jgi:hypothetical protein
MMSTNWTADHYRGYGMVVGRHLQNSAAHFGITKPCADGQPETIHQGFCQGVYSNDDDAWDAAYAAARAYIDGSLPALA